MPEEQTFERNRKLQNIYLGKPHLCVLGTLPDESQVDGQEDGLLHTRGQDM